MPNNEFETRLKSAKEKIKRELEAKKGVETSNLGHAFKMSTELVASVAVGTIIGFILDNWFDTKPWFIITFFFAGVAAGILNVVRSAKKMNKGK